MTDAIERSLAARWAIQSLPDPLPQSEEDGDEQIDHKLALLLLGNHEREPADDDWSSIMSIAGSLHATGHAEEAQTLCDAIGAKGPLDAPELW